MPYIKRLVMRGFKSFPRETEILLDRAMNCVVGPNGSGKSNVTDAICFALGRLSIKSMRAARSSNLIFAGTKQYKAANEASVEIVFDNSDKGFSLSDSEVSLKRIVRKNGQGIYRINNQTKTRQEILELLAQAGIDPHGFNIVLQGEISSFVKMQGEERRKIIEEVAGISVYEVRKQKSLKELERTEQKLKEVSAVLRERTAYLRNLETERQQALRFKKLEETVQKCKASILNKKITDKNKEKSKVLEEMEQQKNQLDKLKIIIGKTQEEIKNQEKRIEEINNSIQKSSGVQQTNLSEEIGELKAEIAGLNVRKENYQSQIEEIGRRREELEKNIQSTEQEIKEMRKTKGKSRKQDLDIKREQLDEFEEQRKKLYSLKSSLDFLNEKVADKQYTLKKLEQESKFTLEKIEESEKEIRFKEAIDENKSKLLLLKKSLEEKKESLIRHDKIILESEKQISSFEAQADELEKIKSQVSILDTCPLCKTKITAEHKGHIEKEANQKISIIQEKIKKLDAEKNKSWEAKESLVLENKKTQEEIEEREKQMIKLDNLSEKKHYLRKLIDEKKQTEEELQETKTKKSQLEKKLLDFKSVEERYDSLKLEVEEITRHEEVDIDMETTLKQRELDRMKLIIKQISREEEELEEEIQDITKDLEDREQEADEKEKQEQIIREKFKKMLEEKNHLQDKIRLFESDLLKKQNQERIIEQEINNFKIRIAEFNAQLESLEQEFKEFSNIEIIKASIEILQEKLQKTQQILSTIGSVNLRALEVYDEMKKEYDSIAMKVEQLGKEKEEILKIIEEIDKKKTKAFNKTLEDINALFSRNFSQLSTKGEAFLEPQNKEDVFSKGLDIIIKVARGKYFDVTSLSGGEQTLIALSLIFAIQEYKPYSFYIFDEIDAALDKRNSERLSLLLKKHMKAGQYLIITHNDALISEATTLYGVSMQEGISKILSLQI